jgi:oxygen-dependent protoporphyrinogen oxidase
MQHIHTETVIVGAGLTGLTLAYYLTKAGKEVMVVEKSNHVGGVIKTHEQDGFVYEGGPTTGVLGSEEIVQLFEDLKKDCTLELTREDANERWILKNNQWQPLPSGLKQAIGTPLFTLYDKFRFLGEPFRKKGTNPNETLAEMVKRRLGKSFLDYAVDPFISGIYAGNPADLITRYALPKLYWLEQDYGSFIKGAIKKKKEPKTELQKKATREVFSVKGGLGNLIKALEKNIPADKLLCSCEDVDIELVENGYLTQLKKQDTKIVIHSKNVVSTIGGYALADLLPFINKDLIQSVAKTNYAKVLQVAVGYKKWSGRRINAFGGLVPTLENKNVLGVLFPGSLFKGRCPKKGALLSVFMGGMKKPEMIQKSDVEIEEIVLETLSSTLGEQNKPDLLKVFRYHHAIPQYDILSEEKLKAIEEMEKQYPGLFLVGNIRDGIGMADRVKQAVLLVRNLTV